MHREFTRTTLQLSCDSRLVAGVGGAVAHHAERAGFNESARDLLASALEDFCRQTLPLLRTHGHGNGNGNRLAVAVTDFEDRIEIVVQHRALAHPLSRSGGALRTLDRVEYDARNGELRTTLVKYLKGRRGR